MIKQVLLLVLLFLASGLALSVSESKSVSLLPHAADSFNVSYIQMKNAGTCSYSVVITTSCSSPRYTRDQISISFGDAYGNQIYAPRLDDPASGTFESCSSDTFQITGPCAYQICYVYLYRSGLDGWKPESVKINGYNGRPVTFYYNTYIPRDTWYGFNLCNGASSSSSYQVSMQKWLIFMVLGFVLSWWL
ncbi:Embryo-specific protein ATS3B [Glycine soja]